MHLAGRIRPVFLAGLLAACGSPAGGTPAASPATSGVEIAAPTVATPSATSILVPGTTANAVPAMTTVTPTVIDVPGASGTIALATDGTTIWAATNGAVLRIDAATNVVISLPAPSQSGDTTLAIADDGLWMTRWGGGHVYRLDPETGEVQLSIELAAAVRLAFVGNDLWVGRESTGEMLLVDRTSGSLGRSLPAGAYGTAGLGDLWFTSGGMVKRIDPATAAVKASIAVQNEGNCDVSGTFPDQAWISCFGRDVVARSASRVDPAGDRIAALASLPPCHGGSFAILDRDAWFVGTFEDPSRTPFGGLLRLDPATGALEQFVSIGPADPNTPVVAGGAIWVPDEAGHRILRVDATALRA
jgi:streptogramin lyase